MATAIRRVEPAENELLASLEAKAKQPNAFFRVMANRPEALKHFLPFYGAVVGPGSVERRIKSMLYLAVSYVNQCPFCIAANTPGAKKAGVTDEELAAVRAEDDVRFTEAERAALAYARELTRKASANTEALRTHFSDEQVVEMTMVIAMANFTNRFNNGLNVLPEA